MSQKLIEKSIQLNDHVLDEDLPHHLAQVLGLGGGEGDGVGRGAYVVARADGVGEVGLQVGVEGEGGRAERRAAGLGGERGDGELAVAEQRVQEVRQVEAGRQAALVQVQLELVGRLGRGRAFQAGG